MIKSDKKLKELKATLSAKSSDTIVEAVKSLRNEEIFEGAISLLISLYDRTDERKIMNIIEDFFNDIKDQSLRPEVIAGIKKPWKSKTISMIASSCWQSGLDYSDYLNDLADVFLSGDYATAIECMTAISESLQYADRKNKDSIIMRINESPLAYSYEKEPLRQELISILNK